MLRLGDLGKLPFERKMTRIFIFYSLFYSLLGFMLSKRRKNKSQPDLLQCSQFECVPIRCLVGHVIGEAHLFCRNGFFRSLFQKAPSIQSPGCGVRSWKQLLVQHPPGWADAGSPRQRFRVELTDDRANLQSLVKQRI